MLDDNYFQTLYGEKVDQDSRSLDEQLNGSRGSEYWKERDYSCDPDYDAVDPEVFDYLELLENLDSMELW